MSLKTVIITSGSLTLLYLLSLLLELPFILVLGLLLASIASLPYMAVRILKDPYSTPKTFEEYFYQDREDLRRSGNE